MAQWQPIKTAPKDGTWVLVWNGMTGVYKSRWEDGEWPMLGWDGREGIWFPVPSHWMPISAPPHEAGQDQ